MPKQKRRGAKPKGREHGSDYYNGYHAGWRYIEIGAKKRNVKLSTKSEEYKRGRRAGLAAARRYYK